MTNFHSGHSPLPWIHWAPISVQSDNVKVKSVEYDNNNTPPTKDPGTVRHAVHPASEPGAGLQQEQTVMLAGTKTGTVSSVARNI